MLLMTDEKRRKRARHLEHQEYDKILQTLDYQDKRNLSSHLLLTTHYKKTQPPRRLKNARGKEKDNDDDLVIDDYWTAWPLPSNVVPRPKATPSSSSEAQDHPSRVIQAEIEATLLRNVRSRLQSQDPSVVSANEHPPYHVTREVTNNVLAKFDRLLHALGRIKSQQVSTERAELRLPKSKWDEIVGIAGISECIDSEETMKRIMERCNKLFQENISWEVERDILE